MAKKLFYNDQFEEFWRAYKAPAASSKKVAHESYLRAERDELLPAHPILLQAVASYLRYLDKNSRPGREHPKAHAATWINQARWEGFIDEAKQEAERAEKRMTEKTQVGNQSWPKEILDKLQLTEAVINTWILPTKLVPGSPALVLCPTPFHATWLNQRFRSQLDRALGAGVEVIFDGVLRA